MKTHVRAPEFVRWRRSWRWRRGQWAWRNPDGGRKNKPPKRLLRDHRKAVRELIYALWLAGHDVPTHWVYRYGRSSETCRRCGQTFMVKLGAGSLQPARCQRPDRED